MNGIQLIEAERKRQVESEGWSAEHDEQHLNAELTMAAVAYAVQEATQTGRIQGVCLAQALWPIEWDKEFWKPSKSRIRNLSKAGALIAAEIDRLQRLEAKGY